MVIFRFDAGYAIGLRNFFSLYRPIAHSWLLLDNSGADAPGAIAWRNAGGPVQIVKNSPSRNRPPASRVEAPGHGIDMKKVIVAARKAVRAAVRRHKLLGQSIAVWEDGKVVIVPASRIKI